jgi:hypothetical protein
MRNFNPDLAAEVVELLEQGEVFLGSAKLKSLIHEADLQVCCSSPCVENCDHCSISYNDSVLALRQILADAQSAPFEQAYGILFPKFVCIASKAFAGIELPVQESQDGNIGSESSPEQSSEENTGGSKLPRRSRSNDR